MTEGKFEELLDRYGSDLSLWPARDREAGRAMLEQNTAARALLNAQKSVDAQLDEAMVVPHPHGLEQKVMARFAAQKRRIEFGNWRMLFWKPAFAAACSLAFGFYLGAANQALPIDLAEDLTSVTFYDYEAWSGGVNDEP